MKINWLNVAALAIAVFVIFGAGLVLGILFNDAHSVAQFQTLIIAGAAFIIGFAGGVYVEAGGKSDAE